MLGILVGVTTIILIVSLIAGLDGMVAQEFSRVGTRVLYVSRNQWGSGYFWRAPQIGQKELEAVKRVYLTEYVVPYRQSRGGLTRNGVELQNMQIVGTTEDFHLVREIPIVMGRFFSRFEAEKATRITVIGWDIYERLFPGGEDPLNEYVEIGGIPFRVIGVIEKQGNMMTNMSGMAADYNAYIPLPCANKMFGRWRGITIMASAPSEDLVYDLEQELRIALRAVRGLKPGEADNFGINRQDFFLNEFRNATKYMWAALIGIAALSLLVGGIGVMNIMLISVTERTREIGVRKALGAKRRNIMLQFLLEALIVCWSGGLIGAIIGFFMSAIIAALSPLVFVFSWPAVALGTAFTSGIGIFFGLYPAIKAARKSPVEALRYE